ncbi:hypothetical protein L6R49_29135 [Myxococcota bacterium]|nr:hypothetical protein [Myxococcota bacterium]
MRAAAALLSLLALGSCRKVPLFDVNAGFSIADASWFAEEETLFIFYNVSADQGIGDPSVIELTYTTDDERVDWTPIDQFATVHTHVPVDCGETSLCGSTSIKLDIEPRDVRLRLRYHVDGELTLDPRTVFNVIGPGPAHLNRSLLVYGVFDDTNTWVQWRGRHHFPTIRNQEAEALGLRRDVLIEDQGYGIGQVGDEDNPYGYGGGCGGEMTALGFEALPFQERARFNPEQLPVEAASSPVVCSSATVTDAKGTFTTTAVARKNPEVRPAFPELRSPIHAARRVPFFLAPCNREISPEHAEMQRQRLFLEDEPTFCIDDWADPAFVDKLTEAMSDAVEDARVYGEDMVLVIALHRDITGMAEVVQEALTRLVPAERHRATPRLAGAFVFDSIERSISGTELNSSTLWCPATVDSLGLSLACAVIPDIPELELGPLSVGFLPILPTRAEYLDFLETYSARLAGEITSSEFLTPEFAANVDHADLGELGMVTFFNDEVFSAEIDDAFSYCAQEDAQLFMFRTEITKSDLLGEVVDALCAEDPTNIICTVVTQGILPIELLPTWHSFLREPNYELGMYWEFPYLLRAEYQTYVAGAVSAFSLSVPFGVPIDAEGSYGAAKWLEDSFRMDLMLTQCDRFCEHPVFDRAEVYQVTQSFRTDYAATCYRPEYPAPGDDGFPLDP